LSVPFKGLALLCEKIRSTTSKLEKISLLGNFLKGLEEEDLKISIKLLSGKIFPPWIDKELQIGYSTILYTISEISGEAKGNILNLLVKKGDLGETAFLVFNKGKKLKPLIEKKFTLKEIYEKLDKISEYKGENSYYYKKSILRELFLNSEPIEIKYLVKVITNELRIGLHEGLIEEAMAYAFNKTLSQIKEAFLILPDLSEVAVLAKKDELSSVSITPLKPTNFMLAEAMQSGVEITSYFNKQLYVEFKYDGIRAQIHKKGNTVKIFSRKLEDITFFVPEIEEALKKVNGDFILDGEILSFKNGKPLPFNILQRRLRRKNIDQNLIEEIPLSAIIFDILYFETNPCVNLTLKQRKETLNKLNFDEPILFAKFFVVKNPNEIEELFKKSLESGFEGLVIKDPDSIYTPGKRGKHWIKLKREFDTIDAVIVAAEYGHGKRAGILSDYTFAVKDKNGELKIIGKAYSGLTDEEMEFLDKKLRSLAITEIGNKIIVRPEIVIEVAFDSIQRSDRHDSGFALRFPRIKRIRFDKSVEEIDTLERVIEIYEAKKKLYANHSLY
jgi:DNA ligase-1